MPRILSTWTASGLKMSMLGIFILFIFRRLEKNEERNARFAVRTGAIDLRRPADGFLEQFPDPPWTDWAPGRFARRFASRAFFGRDRTPQFWAFDLNYKKNIHWTENYAQVSFVIVRLSASIVVRSMPSIPAGYTAVARENGFLYFYRETARFKKGDLLSLDELYTALNHGLYAAAEIERLNARR